MSDQRTIPHLGDTHGIHHTYLILNKSERSAYATGATGGGRVIVRQCSTTRGHPDPKRTGPTISVFKQNHIQQLIVETGTDLNRFLDYFGLKAIKDLAEADFVRVIRSLESRRAA